MAKGLSPRQVQRLVAVDNQRCLSTARLSGSQAAESVLRRHTTKPLELSLNVLWQLLAVSQAAGMVTYSITRAPTVLARLATVKFHILTRVAVLLTSVVSLSVVLARTVTEERVQMVTQTLVSKRELAIVTLVSLIVVVSGILHTRVAGTQGRLLQFQTLRPVAALVTSRRNPYQTVVLGIAV